jgi:hypothetical protein
MVALEIGGQYGDGAFLKWWLGFGNRECAKFATTGCWNLSVPSES